MIDLAAHACAVANAIEYQGTAAAFDVPVLLRQLADALVRAAPDPEPSVESKMIDLMAALKAALPKCRACGQSLITGIKHECVQEGPNEALRRAGFLLATKSRFVSTNRVWEGKPFVGVVYGYRPDDMKEIRALLDTATQEILNG